MRKSLGSASLAACILLAGAASAQSKMSTYVVNWYSGGAIPSLMDVTVITALEATKVTFQEHGSAARRDKPSFNLIGQEEAISTLDGSFALITSGPGVNLYVFRSKGSSVIKSLECHGPYEPEIGKTWVMCFRGRAEDANRIYPATATIYLLGDNQAFSSHGSVAYDRRYALLKEIVDSH